MAYGNINVDTVTTSTAGGVLGAGNASLMKNRIINGAMVISQRNGTSSITPSSSFTYSLDRWQYGADVGSKVSIQQNAGSVTPPVGFTKYLGITSLSAYTAGSTEQYNIQQKIEGFNIADLGFGTANAKTVTLSFQVYSSLTGSFSGSILNTDGTRSYPFSYTVSSANTWTSASVTIAGDTTGTWATDNSAGMTIYFNLGCGSTFLGTAGAWTTGEKHGVTGSVSVVGTNGATFYITGVQLEVGSSATGFEYRQYGTELALCQRYAYVLGGASVNQVFAQGFNTSSITSNIQVFPPVPMRASPSLSVSASSDFQISNGVTASVCSAVITAGAQSSTCSLVQTTSSAVTQYQPVRLEGIGTTNARMVWSAEL